MTVARHVPILSELPNRKKPRRRKIEALIRLQLDYVQKNLDTIDALIVSGAALSSLKFHRSQRLLVISELSRQQSILLYSKTRSMPDRIVNLFQSHIRPMMRSKVGAAVKFSPKISVSVRNGFAFCTGLAGNHITNQKP